MHVASLWRLHRDQVEYGEVVTTGYVGPCYQYFIVFYVLDLMSILVSYFITYAYK
jgi:hypothetical protein